MKLSLLTRVLFAAILLLVTGFVIFRHQKSTLLSNAATIVQLNENVVTEKKFTTKEDFADYAEKLRKSEILKVEPTVQRDGKLFFEKTRSFIHRTNPKFDLSKCSFAVVPTIHTTGTDEPAENSAVVIIKERQTDSTSEKALAEASFDARGELQAIHWLNMPDGLERSK